MVGTLYITIFSIYPIVSLRSRKNHLVLDAKKTLVQEHVQCDYIALAKDLSNLSILTRDISSLLPKIEIALNTFAYLMPSPSLST